LLVLNVVLEWVLPRGPEHGHPPPLHHQPASATSVGTAPPPSPPLPPEGRPDRGPGSRPLDAGPLADIGVRLVLLLVAIWVGARWLTRPLSQLANAAQNLANDLNRPDLPELGPLECRETTRVFNHMQQRSRQQLTEKNQLLAAVSHDLRTPLTRMRLRMAQMPSDAHTEGLRRDVADMQQLVDATLEHFMGAGSAPSVMMVDVASLLNSLADDLQDMGHCAAAFRTFWATPCSTVTTWRWRWKPCPTGGWPSP
jgi:signal transduction histidine kinase